METVASRINELVSRFINDITILAKDVALTTLNTALDGGTVAPGYVSKRSPEELAKIGETVLAQIVSEPGLRIEQINERLGTKTRQIFRPLKKLIAAGEVTTQGDRRATTYWPGKSTAAAKKVLRDRREAKKGAEVKSADKLTKGEITAAIKEAGSVRGAARALGYSKSTFRDAAIRKGVQKV